jgi:Bacterial regulatory proteins, gntR family
VTNVRRDLLKGTPEEVDEKLEQLSKGITSHEYVAGTQLRMLAALLARNTDLHVSVVTYDNESQELEVRLAGSPGCDPIMIDRNSAGTECQVTLDQWLNIGTEPDIENIAGLVTALLHVCADPRWYTRASGEFHPDWRAMMDDSNPDQRRYMRLAESLREEITSGLRAPGSQLPSIGDLSQLYNCSRKTAGHAMQVLVDERLIYRQLGLGYFVTVHHGSRG